MWRALLPAATPKNRIAFFCSRCRVAVNSVIEPFTRRAHHTQPAVFLLLLVYTNPAMRHANTDGRLCNASHPLRMQPPDGCAKPQSKFALKQTHTLKIVCIRTKDHPRIIVSAHEVLVFSSLLRCVGYFTFMHDGCMDGV